MQKARPRLHGFGVQKASKATQAARVLCAEREQAHCHTGYSVWRIMAMQSRDSMSLTDRESSSDESDCSLETVQSFAPGTPRKRKRNAKCGGEKPAAKQSREEGEKGGDTPSDTEIAKRDNEVVTSDKQTATTSEQTPAEGPSTRKGKMAKPQPMGKVMRQGIGQPVFCDHPVIIEDLITPGPARLRSLDWKMADILKNEVGSVRSIRPISEHKIIVGCDSSLQQSRLVKRLKIGQVEVRCTIPEPTVQGVVRGIPRHVQMDEFMRRIEWVSDNGGHTHSKVKVKGASRLTFKDGTASRAIRVTFVAQKLPLLMKINKQEYSVRPYVAEALRCYRCHRYGHTKQQCKAKQEVCQTCGRQGHSSSWCKASQEKCCNCGDEHSAGYTNCRVRKEWQVANKLRAESYMPMALALQQAKKLVSAEGQKTQGPPAEREQPLPSLSPAWRSDTPLVSRRSYASVVAPRPKPKPRRKRSEEGRPKPTPQPRERTQRQEEVEKSETLDLISTLKETVDTLRKELEEERAARKQLLDEVISLRRIRQDKRAETGVPSPSWLQGVLEAGQGKVDEGVLQLVSQILLAAMDKTSGNQS